MTSFVKTLDMGGLKVKCESIEIGVTKPGRTGTLFTGLASTLTQTTGTLTLTAAQAGTTVYLDKADGIVVTLPAPVAGLSYKFIVKTAVTSNAYKISTGTQNVQFLNGTITSLQAAATAVFTGDGSTHDNFSMNGSTTGGLTGTEVTFTAISSTLWTVSGFVRSSGAAATPFATA